MDLRLDGYGRDGWFVLEVEGEIDMATAPKLRERLLAAVNDGAHRVVVDLSEVAFVDSTGLGVLIGAIVLGLVGAGAAKTGAQSAAALAGGAAAMSSGAKPGPADYAVDLLLRPAPGGGEVKAAPGGDEAVRAEANRIFASAIANSALSQRDYDYLTQVVAARTGLPQNEAQQRVQSAVTEAKDLEIKVREQADKARRSAIITGFMAAVSLLIGMLAAIGAAAAGGRHRDEDRIPAFSGHRFW